MTVNWRKTRFVLHYQLVFNAYNTYNVMSSQGTGDIILMDKTSETFEDIGDKKLESDILVSFCSVAITEGLVIFTNIAGYCRQGIRLFTQRSGVLMNLFAPCCSEDTKITGMAPVDRLTQSGMK